MGKWTVPHGHITRFPYGIKPLSHCHVCFHQRVYTYICIYIYIQESYRSDFPGFHLKSSNLFRSDSVDQHSHSSPFNCDIQVATWSFWIFPQIPWYIIILPYGGFRSWGYPNSWMVSKGTSYKKGWFRGTSVLGNLCMIPITVSHLGSRSPYLHSCAPNSNPVSKPNLCTEFQGVRDLQKGQQPEIGHSRCSKWLQPCQTKDLQAHCLGRVFGYDRTMLFFSGCHWKYSTKNTKRLDVMCVLWHFHFAPLGWKIGPLIIMVKIYPTTSGTAPPSLISWSGCWKLTIPKSNE